MAAVAIALIASVVFFGFTDVDRWIQDLLFDFPTGQWLVDSRAPLLRVLFYRLPKLALAAWGLLLLGRGLLGLRKGTAPALRRRAVEMLFLFCCLAAVPLLTGLGKQVTKIHCPGEFERYGGNVPAYGWFDPRPEVSELLRPGRCFPAAHASGGFAIMALALVGAQLPSRMGWGLVIGWGMGGYQMVRGVHYLSHTVISMILAWGVILLLARCFGLDDRHGRDPRKPVDAGSVRDNS